jgi:hypothetical protein
MSEQVSGLGSSRRGDLVKPVLSETEGAARRNELFCKLMMDWEATTFFLRPLEFIKTSIHQR